MKYVSGARGQHEFRVYKDIQKTLLSVRLIRHIKGVYSYSINVLFSLMFYVCNKYDDGVLCLANCV